MDSFIGLMTFCWKTQTCFLQICDLQEFSLCQYIGDCAIDHSPKLPVHSIYLPGLIETKEYWIAIKLNLEKDLWNLVSCVIQHNTICGRTKIVHLEYVETVSEITLQIFFLLERITSDGDESNA